MRYACCAHVEYGMAVCFVELRRSRQITPILDVFEGLYDIIAEPWFEDFLLGSSWMNIFVKQSNIFQALTQLSVCTLCEAKVI